MQLNARELFNQDRGLTWNLAPGKYQLELEDGAVVEATDKSIIFNRHCWELMKPYPNTPITKECDVYTYIGDGSFNIDTTTKFLEGIFKHICEVNGIVNYADKDPLLELVYRVQGIVMNEIIHRASAYVHTIDAVDLVEVINSETVKAAHKALEPYPDSVERTYKDIFTHMNDKESTNNYVSAYRSKSVNENQANQCVGPRGFVTALDRTVYKLPIMSGFIRGLGSPYELMTESLTAAKSLTSSERSIRTSEYGSRRVQLITMPVTGISTHDCGSTELWDIVLTKRFLANMKGKWYCTEEDPTLRMIKGDEQHLIDEVIKVRTTFTCREQARDKVCHVCLGDIANNIPANSNVGYTGSAALMEKITQALLSFKHLTKSVKSSAVKLVGTATKFLEVGEIGDELHLRKDLDIRNLAIVLPSRKLSKLTDALNVTSEGVCVNKIGDLDAVGFRDLSKGINSVHETVNVQYMDRLANISRELLNHIRTSEYYVDLKNNYVVPLSGFNIKDPILTVPLKEASLLAFGTKVVSHIEVTGRTGRRGKDSLKAHVLDLLDMIYDQFNISMTLVEGIVYGTTAYNPDEGNYKLGRNSATMAQVNRSELFRNRSISGNLVFEEQLKDILDYPEILFSDRPADTPHPLDVLFLPQEVIENRIN